MSSATQEQPKTDQAKADQQNAVAVQKPREVRVVHDDGPMAYLFDTARFEHMYRIAQAMAKASLIPAHIKGKDFDETVGNCFRVINQAVRWGFDPWAVIDETYVVRQKLGYQGKLVAAVINARAKLAQPLAPIYNNGKGDDLAAAIFGSMKPISDEAWDLLESYAQTEDGKAYARLMRLGVLCIRITVGQAKTDNDMWKKDPQQKLFYSGATKWARRHRPEVIQGVLTEDDIERMVIDVDANQSAAHLEKQLLGASDPLAPQPIRDPSGAHADLPADHGKGVASEAQESGNPTVEDRETIKANFLRELSQTKTISASAELASAWRKDHPDLADDFQAITEAHVAEIKAGRGGRSNG